MSAGAVSGDCTGAAARVETAALLFAQHHDRIDARSSKAGTLTDSEKKQMVLAKIRSLRRAKK
jgi:hypothetical protein